MPAGPVVGGVRAAAGGASRLTLEDVNALALLRAQKPITNVRIAVRLMPAGLLA